MNFRKSIRLAIINLTLLFLQKTGGAPSQILEELIVDEGTFLIDNDGSVVEVLSSIVDQEPVVNQLGRNLENNNILVQHDDDEEDEETAGPGYQGILAGLTGIFSNVVSGNLGKLVESTFNFVPSAQQGNVKGVYNSLLGKPPLTTSTEPSEVEEVVSGASDSDVASTKKTAAVTAAAAAGSGDDEEEAGRKLVLKVRY